MVAVPLTLGAYTARSLIASAQRCLNLFPESNPPDSPSPYTFYMRPGLEVAGQPLRPTNGRGLYVASNKELFAAVGDGLYFIDSGWIFHELGVISAGLSQVSMIDNREKLIVATGEEKVGYEIDLATHSFRQIGSSLGTITLVKKGHDYDEAPIVQISAPEDANGVQATAIAKIDKSTGKVTEFKVHEKGKGYKVAPTITLITASLGSGATATAALDDENWLGAVGSGYLDTFLLFSRPQSNQFFSSLSNVSTFDPLYFASKTGRQDSLQTIAIVHREIWLLGALTTECWFNAGASGFPFAEVSGVFVEHGTIAPASVVTHGLELMFLSQDKDGKAIVLMISQYMAKRISTYAIETAIRSYKRIDDAIGMIYQLEGHVFYVLTFPSADATWVFDMMEGQWHEEAFSDAEGQEHRHRACDMAYAYGENVCLDWEDGTLYRMSLNLYADAEQMIVCRRGFPHMTNGSKRISYSEFIAEMEVGDSPGGIWHYDKFGFNADFNADFDVDVGPTLYDVDPQIYLRWSDDRGKSWGNPIGQSLGGTGEYNTSVQFQRLGMARNRVFELFWALPIKTALNGASLEATPLGS